MIISRCYPEKHPETGPIDDIRDRGNDWQAGGRLGGLVAKPLSFEIDKRSGMITSMVGPGYKSPFDMSSKSDQSNAADHLGR